MASVPVIFSKGDMACTCTNPSVTFVRPSETSELTLLYEMIKKKNKSEQNLHIKRILRIAHLWIRPHIWIMMGAINTDQTNSSCVQENDKSGRISCNKY